MDITVKMARFQIKQSVLIGNTTLVHRKVHLQSGKIISEINTYEKFE